MNLTFLLVKKCPVCFTFSDAPCPTVCRATEDLSDSDVLSVDKQLNARGQRLSVAFVPRLTQTRSAVISACQGQSDSFCKITFIGSFSVIKLIIKWRVKWIKASNSKQITGLAPLWNVLFTAPWGQCQSGVSTESPVLDDSLTPLHRLLFSSGEWTLPSSLSPSPLSSSPLLPPQVHIQGKYFGV